MLRVFSLCFFSAFFRLRIEQDNICFFQVLIATLFNFIATISAVQPFYIHDAYTKSVELILFLHFHVRSLDMLKSIEIDKSRYKSIASPENSFMDKLN